MARRAGKKASGEEARKADEPPGTARRLLGWIPVGFAAAGAIVGFSASSLGLYDRVANLFFTPKYRLADQYFLIGLDPNMTWEEEGQAGVGAAVDALLAEFPSQFPKYKLYRPAWLQDRAVGRGSAAAFLCADWAGYASSVTEANRDDFIAVCTDNIRLFPTLATYAVSNEDPKTATGLRIVADRATLDRTWLATFDLFQTFYPDREQNCVFEVNFEQCIADLGEVTEVTSDPLPPLRTGETLLFPLYVAWGGSLDLSGADAGPFADERSYDGIVAFPMLFPTRVTVDGATAIGDIRRMSATPTMSAGQFEGRG